MQQFTIPQFIDVEDKIIGPITIRQFIIILAGFLLIALSYKLFDFSLFVTVALAILAISGSFAFVKINGRPLHLFVLNLIQTFKRPKLRVWQKRSGLAEEDYKISGREIIKSPVMKSEKTGPSLSRLAELSLIVDTRGSYKGEKDQDPKIISVA